MFKVSHVTKIYKNKHIIIKAIDDVSFVLPSRGMIFIVGKSGSGKSTLLNSLGTLEKVDSGEIYFNNLNLTQLSNKESSSFRNEEIGFMFQDFCLLEDLTVYQNISLSLEIQCLKNNDYIDTILKKLDLYDFKNTKVIKLSVGQKERVAIARAMIKNPKVILCDEPTGNLDTANSEIILEYLKGLSKDKLVVVITHNLKEAYKFADRILELDNGKIVKDLSYPYSKKEALKIGNTLYLNELIEVKQITKSEINYEIIKGNIKDIKHIETLFLPTDNKKIEENNFEEIKLNKKRLSFINCFKWHYNLFKKQYLRNFLYTLVSVFLLIAFSMTFVLVNDPGKELSNKLMLETSLPLYNVTKLSKAKLNNAGYQSVSSIKDEEKTKLDACYFPLSNYAIVHRTSQMRIRRNEIINTMKNFERFYASASYGTLYGLTKEDVKNIFNDPNVYVEDLAPYKKEGVYLTDYTVDAYRFFASRGFVPGGTIPYTDPSEINNGYCNGVIHTNYKNKYKSILKQLDKKTLMLENIDSIELKDFVEFASRYLAVNYSFEKNFNEYVVNPTINNYQGVPKAEIKTVDEGPLIEADVTSDYYFYNSSINDDSGYSMTICSNLLDKTSFGRKSAEEWNEFLKDRIVNLKIYDCDLDKTQEFQVKVKVSDKLGVKISKDLLICIQKMFIKDYGLYFLNANDALQAMKNLNNDRFKFITLNDEAYAYIDHILFSFKDLFSFFMIVLFITSVGIIILVGALNVKALKYKIGILKGSGISNRDLTSFYIINIACILFIFVCFLFPFTYLFNELGNNLLLSAIKKETKVSFLNELIIFNLNPSVLLIDISVMILSLTLSVSLSLFKVNKMKPIDILKRI